MTEPNEPALAVQQELLSDRIEIAEPPRDPFLGMHLGNYEIISEIARGGMGVVYRAKHLHLPREAAVKVITQHSKLDWTGRKRFENEARMLSLLSHRNIVGLEDFGFEDSNPVLIMEYLQGETLAERLAKGPLELDAFFELFEQVCQGLQYAHSKGMVHRDLKPSNIFLAETDGDQTVKIIDFGLAKSSAGDDQKLTQTGQIIGTPLYMSPEHFQGMPLDARSDIYALGCVMFEALTGTPPFQGSSSFETGCKHVNEAPPAVTAANKSVSKALQAVIHNCLQKAAEQRYATVEDLSDDLKRARANKNISSKVRHTKRLKPQVAIVATAAFAVFAACCEAGIYAYAQTVEAKARDYQASREIEKAALAFENAGSAFALTPAADRASNAYVAPAENWSLAATSYASIQSYYMHAVDEFEHAAVCYSKANGKAFNAAQEYLRAGQLILKMNHYIFDGPGTPGVDESMRLRSEAERAQALLSGVSGDKRTQLACIEQNLGLADYSEGKHPSAIRHFKQTLEYCRQLGQDPNRLTRVWAYIRSSAEKTSDSATLKEAEEHLK